MVTPERSLPAGAEQRLKELGMKLPPPPEPFGDICGSGADGQSAFSERDASHGGPRDQNKLGRVGAELDVEAGRKAAYLAALNVLAVAKELFEIARQGNTNCQARRVSGHFGRYPRSAESS